MAAAANALRTSDGARQSQAASIISIVAAATSAFCCWARHERLPTSTAEGEAVGIDMARRSPDGTVLMPTQAQGCSACD